MSQFATRFLPRDRTAIAPDGAEVRELLSLERGSMAHFQLAPGGVSAAVTHRTVEEIWFVVSGRGQLWRSQAGHEEIVDLEPGICVTLPLGTHFQFRAAESAPLAVVGVTMPPWPGADEAVAVQGPWSPAG